MAIQWDRVERKSRGGTPGMGEGWRKYPAVRLNKGGLTFNTLAQEAFGLVYETTVDLLISKSNNMIGIKVVPPGDPSIESGRYWTLRVNGPKCDAEKSITHGSYLGPRKSPRRFRMR